jgi:hypothetical protein
MEPLERKQLNPSFAKLLQAVIWPFHLQASSSPETMKARQREVSRRSRGTAGTVHSGKLNRSVQFESSLERNFLDMLESYGEVIWYQEQPLAIPYIFNGLAKWYYPDFCVGLKDGRYFVVEIKDTFEMLQYQNARKLQALWQYCQRHGLGLLVTDGVKTIQDIYERKIDSEFQQILMQHLKQAGAIGIKGFRPLKDRFTTAWQDLPSIVLHEELIWQMRPFCLKTPETDSRVNSAG